MSLDINLTNVQSTPIVVNANTTAENNKVYHVIANATFTDPTPVEGKGFKVFVRNGIAVVGGVSYSVTGSLIVRTFHSGAWSTVYYYDYITSNNLFQSRANLSTNVDTDQASNSKYPSVKAVFDWANSAISWIATNGANVLSHLSNTNNPHSTTATQVDALKRDGSNANSDVDLGTYSLNTKSVKVNGTAGAGHVGLKHQSSGATATGSESVIYADASGNPKWKNDGNAVQAVMLENSAITGATKTKITYDSKGLVTAGADATTADIADSTNKRYVTDAQLTVLGNTSGTNTGDETQSSILSKLGWWNILNQTAGTVSSGTSNTITKSIALPSVPNVLNFRANFLKTGATNTYTVRAYLSEVNNNIGGTAILIATVIGANTAVSNLPLKRTFDIIAGNILGFNSGGSTPTDDVNLSNAKLNLAIPTGTPLYLIFAVQCTSASDSARFESAQINNFSF